MVPPIARCSGLVILEPDLVIGLEPFIGFVEVLAKVDGLPLVFDVVYRAWLLDYWFFKPKIVFLFHHVLREIDPAHFGLGSRLRYLPLLMISKNFLIDATFEDILMDLRHLIVWEILGYVLRGIHHKGSIQVAAGWFMQLIWREGLWWRLLVVVALVIVLQIWVVLSGWLLLKGLMHLEANLRCLGVLRLALDTTSFSCRSRLDKLGI